MTSVVLMLPGQGSQFTAMGAALYYSDPRFSRAFEDFLRAFGPGAERLREVWLNGTTAELSRGSFAQPLLFGIDYAAGVVWLDELGDADVTLVGHSVGELAAATLAGVFDLELAGALLAERARLLDLAPRGGMIGCRAPAALVGELLSGQAVIAAENADDQCVVSCAEDEIVTMVNRLRSAGISCMRVASSEPFHSPLLRPAAGEFEAFLVKRSTALSVPRIPMVSAYSAAPVDGRDALPASFWTRQMAEKVEFWRALRGTLGGEARKFVEIGPGTVLSMAAKRLPSVRTGLSTVVTTMPRHLRGIEQWTRIRSEVVAGN
ncbi:acyltransferase domain-containing protein [Actinocrispum sp. NPDC049592]|uniref:acyltransferase domain-containing protein n=1 Tax=Actinocrispum sp. NPDC049592 TaxID=3154835 RepID=UPI003416CE6D